MDKNNKTIFFQLWDMADKEVASLGEIGKLPLIFQQKIRENFREGNLRNIFRKNSNGSVRLVIMGDNPLFQGVKGVTRICEVYLSLIPSLKKVGDSHRNRFDSIIKRFAHNLVKFQTRFKGNFGRLISDGARSRPFSEFKEEVKRRIIANTDLAAVDVCQISHRASDLDAQIETLRVISGYADTLIDSSIIRADLKKTIFRLTNPFFDEFKKRNIEIIITIPQIKHGDEKVSVEPGLFNAAMWQLLDNASKYALSGENIEITAKLDETPKKLEIKMVSICIDNDEKDKIFLEGSKGRNAGNKAEHGIGLFITRKALALMGAKIYVVNGDFVSDSQGFKYCKNNFTIEFP